MIAQEAAGKISACDRHAESADPDREARPAAAKEVPEPASLKSRSLSEEFVDRFPKLRRFIRQPCRPIQVDGEPERRAG